MTVAAHQSQVLWVRWTRNVLAVQPWSGYVKHLVSVAPMAKSKSYFFKHLHNLSISCFSVKQQIQTLSHQHSRIYLFKWHNLDARSLTFNMAGIQRSPSRVNFITGSEVYVQSPMKMWALHNFTSWLKKRNKPSAKYFLDWSSASSMTYRRFCTTAMPT